MYTTKLENLIRSNSGKCCVTQQFGEIYGKDLFDSGYNSNRLGCNDAWSAREYVNQTGVTSEDFAVSWTLTPEKDCYDLGDSITLLYTIEPASDEAAKKIDGRTYTFGTAIDDPIINAVVYYKNGGGVGYESGVDSGKNRLEVKVGEWEDGLEKIVVEVTGVVPSIPGVGGYTVLWADVEGAEPGALPGVSIDTCYVIPPETPSVTPIPTPTPETPSVMPTPTITPVPVPPEREVVSKVKPLKVVYYVDVDEQTKELIINITLENVGKDKIEDVYVQMETPKVLQRTLVLNAVEEPNGLYIGDLSARESKTLTQRFKLTGKVEGDLRIPVTIKASGSDLQTILIIVIVISEALLKLLQYGVIPGFEIVAAIAAGATALVLRRF